MFRPPSRAISAVAETRVKSRVSLHYCFLPPSVVVFVAKIGVFEVARRRCVSNLLHYHEPFNPHSLVQAFLQRPCFSVCHFAGCDLVVSCGLMVVRCG